LNGRRWIGFGVAILLLVAACGEGSASMLSPKTPRTQSLAIRWHQGPVGTYKWQWITDWSDLLGKPFNSTLGGDCSVAVLSVGSAGTATLQVRFTLDAAYVTSGSPQTYVYRLDVGPRGMVSGNPDGQFVDLPALHTVLPLLPPAGATTGARWHDKYSLPNPQAGNTRDYTVEGQYVRDERIGGEHLAVLQVRLFATVDDTMAYEALFGPPPADAPQHINIHDQGTESADVTYWYDPLQQALMKSVAKYQIDETRTFIDRSNNKTINEGNQIGTETVTFSRS
jgi:hypothetical protein